MLENHSMTHGKKRACEKNFLKNMKLLQKTTSKKTIDILKLPVLSSTPIFSANQTTRRKVVTLALKYLKNDFSRISLAIKSIIQACRQKKGNAFPIFFCEEILLSSQNKGTAVQKKIDLHLQIGKKGAYNFFYRW